MEIRCPQSLQQRQTLDIRQIIQQKLEARLCQQIRQEMTLGQYLIQEDLIRSLIRWADEHNSWVDFNKDRFNFTYAKVPYKLASPLADVLGPGFSHCLYHPFEGRAMGQWTLFVVPDMIPKELTDFVAIHERGEEISLGNHYFASQLEFAYSNKRGKIMKYIKFIDEKYPSKFIDLAQEVFHPILPEELMEFLTQQGKRNQEEIEAAEELIETYPLSKSIISRMDKYGKTTDKIYEYLRVKAGETQRDIADLFEKNIYSSAEETADLVNNCLSTILTAIEPSEARVVSRAQVNDSFNNYKKFVDDVAYAKSRRHLNFPDNFELAYKDALNKRRLVTVIKTVEDKVIEMKDVSGFATAANF